MTNRDSAPEVWYWLTIPIALLLLVATAGGTFIPDPYKDNPYFAEQAIGQDLVSLVFVLPAFVISAILTKRGSLRARLLWMGGLVYLVYTYVIAAFAVKYNSFFLIFIALLGFSLYALIGSLVTADFTAIASAFNEKTPVKTVSIFLAVLAGLFYFTWLSELIPAVVTAETPRSILENGTPTNAVHVLDMAWILPAFFIAAVSLWRGNPFGYVASGILLTFGFLIVLAILSMIVYMNRAGFAVAQPQIVVFGTVLLIIAGTLIWYMKNLKFPSE